MDDNDRPAGELLLYQTEDGRTRIECRFETETLWLSQALMAELFQVTVPTINEHLKGIYADQELGREATIRKFRMVRRARLPAAERDADERALDEAPNNVETELRSNPDEG